MRITHTGKGSSMKRSHVDGRLIKCDVEVTVPYDKSPNGEVTLYMKWIPYHAATMESPAEGGYAEVVDWDGVLYDDDLPDVEDAANVKLEEDSDYYCDHMCR